MHIGKTHITHWVLPLDRRTKEVRIGDANGPDEAHAPNEGGHGIALLSATATATVPAAHVDHVRGHSREMLQVVD
eukprot:4021736-Pleurochrysis_carterae.AAC.1